jgi:glycosyltransferase involved in cell wall biosynthesis
MPLPAWMRRLALSLLYKDNPAANFVRAANDRRRGRQPRVRIQSAYANYARSSSRGEDVPPGVNLTGYLDGAFGLAEASRAIAKSVEAGPWPTCRNSIPPYGNGISADARQSISREYRVNLLLASADSMDWVVTQLGREFFDDRFNIGVWWWELPTFPDEWRWTFDYLDEIWVMSQYCQETISRASPIPVRHVAYPLALPEPATLTREQLGLPATGTIFLCTFDYNSSIERKNPLGTIRAFRRAFPEADGRSWLIVKSVNEPVNPWAARLLRSAAGGANVIFMDGAWDRDRVMALLEACDVYVSLHRSEGLGLGMAEAMHFGKIVIATRYSGNMDFMDSSSALLVDYSLTALARHSGPYDAGSTWAEPDLEQASRLMRLAAADTPQLGALRASARARVHQRLDPMRSRADAEALLRRIMNEPIRPTSPQTG